jgi:hypothetical protein
MQCLDLISNTARHLQLRQYIPELALPSTKLGSNPLARVYIHRNVHQNHYPGLKTATKGRMHRYEVNSLEWGHAHKLDKNAMHAFETLADG